MEVLLGPVCEASFLFARESVLPLGTAVGSWTSGHPYRFQLYRFQHPQPVPVQGTSPPPVFSWFLEGPSGKP